MTTLTIRQKIYDYIKVADDKKVKAIYTMLEENIEQSFEPLDDENILKEVERRSAEYKKDKSKAMSWNDAKEKILTSRKSK